MVHSSQPFGVLRRGDWEPEGFEVHPPDKKQTAKMRPRGCVQAAALVKALGERGRVETPLSSWSAKESRHMNYKIIVVIVALLGLGLGAQYRFRNAFTLQIAAADSLGLDNQSCAKNLTTTDGTTYYKITKQRLDPDGVYFEYTPNGGGMGVAKVKFERLSKDLQNQYGYDEAKAQEYEEQCALGARAWLADSERKKKESRDRLYADEVRSAQEQEKRNQDALAMAEQQEASQGTPGAASYYSVYPSGVRISESQHAAAPFNHPLQIFTPSAGISISGRRH